VDARTSQRGITVRAALVIGQVALSMVLLVFAGLMIHSSIAITHADAGMNTANMYVADIQFDGHRYDSADGKRNYLEQAFSRLTGTPGILHVATAYGVPVLGGARSKDVSIPGKPHGTPWETRFVPVNEDYFATVGLPLQKGRLIDASDIQSGRRIAVVNHRLAQQYFANADPIGHTIKLNVLDEIPATPHDAYFEIVGVVGDVANAGLGQPIETQVFIPYTYSGFGNRTLIVRTAVKPELLNKAIQQVLSDIDPNSVLREPGTLEGLLNRLEFMQPRFRLISFSVCAGLGLLLALIGLFGVMAYSVTLRTQEFGIRMALGAQRVDILSLVLRKGVLLVAGGIGVGLIAALFTVDFLKSQLWGVSQFDSRVLMLAPFALLAAGVLACYLPARRATRVDPLVALRYE
jgi:putative ABC transport system permease protein